MSNIKFTEGLKETGLTVDKELKKKAEQVLSEIDMPTTRDEAWKYTRVSKINKVDFKNDLTTITTVGDFNIDSNAISFVFINGNFQGNLSSPTSINGVKTTVLSQTSEIISSNLEIENELFSAVNTLFLNDGLEININDGVELEKPIQIIHIINGQANMSNFKLIINSGKGSKANVITGFFTENIAVNSFANITSEINVGENAHLTVDKLQYENEASFHINTELVYQEKDSTFTINTITLNGGLVRNNLQILVNGTNCTTNLNGAYLLKGKQHVDNHTIVDHRVAHCNSNELYKGVIDGDSTAVFNGKVYVRPDAQKINAFQSNGNVLLSDNASINSKPELEIYADDVKCSHGSTTGQLDEGAVFYLRSRGISEDSARRLLVQAFIGDVLEKIENERFHSFVENCLSERFNWTN